MGFCGRKKSERNSIYGGNPIVFFYGGLLGAV